MDIWLVLEITHPVATWCTQWKWKKKKKRIYPKKKQDVNMMHSEDTRMSRWWKKVSLHCLNSWALTWCALVDTCSEGVSTLMCTVTLQHTRHQSESNPLTVTHNLIQVSSQHEKMIYSYMYYNIIMTLLWQPRHWK